MNICLYGASSNKTDESFVVATEELGEKIALRGHGLVFGGGARGMMGAAARGVKKVGGRVVGIAPSFFNVDGVLFEDCDDFIRTDTMRERKKLLEDKSDAFIVTPGGVGTFDEFFEILTLKQLGQHTKPIAIFNVNGYYDDLKEFLISAVKKGFITEECLELCSFFTNADSMLDYLESYKGEKADIVKLKSL